MSLRGQINNSKYERITRFLGQFHRETFGKLVSATADETDDNAYGHPYFKYDDDVEEFINDMHEIDAIDFDAVDFDYVRNIEKIEDKAEEHIKEDELITKLTLFVRGEKFCEGIASVVLRDVTIQKVFEELREEKARFLGV